MTTLRRVFGLPILRWFITSDTQVRQGVESNVDSRRLAHSRDSGLDPISVAPLSADWRPRLWRCVNWRWRTSSGVQTTERVPNLPPSTRGVRFSAKLRMGRIESELKDDN